MIVTTTTTTTAVVSAGATAALALIVIMALIGLLVVREISAGHSSLRAQRLSRALNIAIIPLALVFALTIVSRLVELFQ